MLVYAYIENIIYYSLTFFNSQFCTLISSNTVFGSVLHTCIKYHDYHFIKYEIESTIDKFFPLKNKENSLERNTCQKKLLEK